jgi:hypothetical protein
MIFNLPYCLNFKAAALGILLIKHNSRTTDSFYINKTSIFLASPSVTNKEFIISKLVIASG